MATTHHITWGAILFALGGCPSVEDVPDEAMAPSADAATPETRSNATTDVIVPVIDGYEEPPRFLVPPPYANAMRTAAGDVLPLYDVHDTTYLPGKVAYRFAESTLVAIDPDERTLFTRGIEAEEWTGGFDLDRDGWPDLVFIHATRVASCNATYVSDREMEIVSGRTGDTLATWMKARDICWSFPSTAYSTKQWATNSILFGEGTSFVSLERQYETQGFFAKYDTEARALSTHYAFVFPSTSQYGSYGAARTNAYGGTPWVDNAHVANGLVYPWGEGERVVFFTSARAVVYSASAYGTGQLVRDIPFIARTDIAGRNYGLVTLDPEVPTQLALLAATNARTVFSDRIAGRRTTDPWGGIERHVTLLDLSTFVLRQRFFSYAHDGGDANQYQGRIAYPDSPWVRRGEGTSSRLAYNVFGAGHWNLHVTQPFTNTDQKVVADLFVWDIRDIDGDGVDEWITSPTDPAQHYMPMWQTQVQHWNESSLALELVSEHEGIPELLSTFRRGRTSASAGSLNPVAILADGGLVFHRADGTVTTD